MEFLEEHIPTITLPDIETNPTPDAANSGKRVAYSPAPSLSGTLIVDPEIDLPSPGMDVHVSYYYNAVSTENSAYGYGRTISPNRYAIACSTPSIVTIARGNGNFASYTETGTGTNVFTSSTPGIFDVLTKDTVNSKWRETTPEGTVSVFPADTTGNRSYINYKQDIVGNIHTYTYGIAGLKNITDALGRLITFHYDNTGLFQYMQDWAGQVTTFQYDTTTATPRNLLATVIGPTGCQTLYGYSDFTLQSGDDWLLSEMTDPSGYQSFYSYDRQRRVVSRTISGQGKWLYLYQQNQTQTVDPSGNAYSYTLDAYGDPLVSVDPMRVWVTNTYSNRQLTSTKDMLGNIRTWTYNTAGRLTQYIDSMGNRRFRTIPKAVESQIPQLMMAHTFEVKHRKRRRKDGKQKP